MSPYYHKTIIMAAKKSYLLKVGTAFVGSRIVLRRFRENEGLNVYDLIRDNASFIEDYLPIILKQNLTKNDAERFVRDAIQSWLADNAYVFGIWDANSAKLIGVLKIFNIDWKVPKGELAFFIDHEFSGKGLMTEALNLACDFGLNELKMERLFLRSPADNYGCLRVARKCGFLREGVLRNDFKTEAGVLIDSVIFGLPKNS